MENAKNFKIIEISNDEIDNIGISEANQKGFHSKCNSSKMSSYDIYIYQIFL